MTGTSAGDAVASARDADRTGTSAPGSPPPGDAPGTAPQATTPGAGRLGLVLAGVGAMAAGAGGLWATSGVRQPAGYQPLGPRVFPTVVCVGLLSLGVAFVSRVVLRPDRALLQSVAAESETSELRTPLLLLGALVGYTYALEPAGYVLATAGFFPIGARLLGSEASIRDAVIGVVLAVGLFELFTELLGVRLPAGPLAPVL